MIWEELESVHDTLVGGIATRRVRDAKDDKVQKRKCQKTRKERKKERKKGCHQSSRDDTDAF